MLSYSRYDIHRKCLYEGAGLVIVTSAVHNASDMLRDTPCMEFASILKNICVVKLVTASCSLLMTTFTKLKVLISRGAISKTDVTHTFVRISHDANRQGSNTVPRENGFHGGCPIPYFNNTNAYD